MRHFPNGWINVIVPTRCSPTELRQLTGNIMMSAGVDTRVYVTGRQASAAVNRNEGLDRVRGTSLIAMVDDDIEFLWVDWLSEMIKVLLRPEVVMVSAQMHHSTPDHKPAYMTGLQDCGNLPRPMGETIVPSKRLLTACCAFKPSGVRFDEGYVGSGFEDIDYCNQLALARPDGLFVVCHDAKVVHRNEQKLQNGTNWQHNLRLYESKWGRLETPQEMLAKWGNKEGKE